MAYPDAAGLLPSSVVVCFPRADAGIASSSWYAISVSLSSIASDYTGNGGVKTFHDTAAASFADSSASTPTNNSTLTTLAQRVARDYFNYLAAANLDIVYADALPISPDGLHDIEWTYRDDMVSTRIFRQPWNLDCDDLIHAGGNSTSPCCPPTVVTVPAFTTSQNNLDLTATPADVYLISSTVPVSITGLVIPTVTPGTVASVTFVNAGSQPITFPSQDAGSSEPNRFIIPGGQPVILQPLDVVTFTLTTLLTSWLLTSTTGNYYPDGLPQLVGNETPGGTPNGVLTTFTTAHTPVGQRPGTSATIDLYRNGVWQTPTNNYTFTGSTITFVSGAIPQTGDILRATYWAVLTATYLDVFVTTSNLTSDLNPSVPGQSVTLTLTTTYLGGINPTGTTEFFDGVSSLGAGSSPSGSSGVVTSTLTTSALTAGSHSLTGVFTGTSGFASSTSPALTQSVGDDVRGSNAACGHPASGTFYKTLTPGAPSATLTITGVPAVIGDLVAIWVVRDHTITVTGATWDGNALTSINAVGLPTGPSPVFLESLSYSVASGGTGDVVVSLSGAATIYAVAVTVFSNGGNGIVHNDNQNGASTSAVGLTGGFSGGTACQLAVVGFLDDLGSALTTAATWTTFYRICRVSAGSGIDLDVGWVQTATNGAVPARLDYSGSCNWGVLYDTYDT